MRPGGPRLVPCRPRLVDEGLLLDVFPALLADFRAAFFLFCAQSASAWPISSTRTREGSWSSRVDCKEAHLAGVRTHPLRGRRPGSAAGAAQRTDTKILAGRVR